MNKPYSLRALGSQFQILGKFHLSKLNKEIFRFFRLFTDDPFLLVVATIQNPYAKTKNLRDIEKKLGPEIADAIKTLNKMHDLDPLFLRHPDQFREVIILYLVNYCCIFNQPASIRDKRVRNKRKIIYASKLLKKIDITQLHILLEDNFFSILYPEIYLSYLNLLKFTRRKYIHRQREINADFRKLLQENGIRAKIQTRFKSISSIHQKIMKKNLLFSQVLDVIGLRIIVEQEEECYQSMVLILKTNAVLLSKIKDYIAVPKENGYQSIHLTIMYEDHPVEIQIRTRQMHQRAQYGEASHLNYKKSK